MKVNIKSIIKLCKKIYDELGPYHNETIYANALEYELIKNDITYAREFTLPVLYDGIKVGDIRCDFLIEKKYLLELKAVLSIVNKNGAVSQTKKVGGEKQVIKYLIALDLEKGYLINFRTNLENISIEYKEIINPNYITVTDPMEEE
tara:strand:+ start:667 stop:1107 length:441 start_codon:yes stop_codon:yes gene_type:complete